MGNENHLPPAAANPSDVPRGEAERLAEFLDHLETLYFALDGKGCVTAVHPRLAAEQGQAREAMLGQVFARAFPRYSGTALENACKLVLSSRQAKTLEWREPAQASKGGKWYVIHIDPLNEGIGVFLNNITREKDLALQLADREQLLAAMLQVSPAGLYRINVKRGYPVFFNQQIISRLGFPEDAFGNTPNDLIERLMHPEDQPRFYQHLAQLSSQPDGTEITFEYRMRDKDSHYHWFLSRDKVYHRDASGAAEEILGSALEITEIKDTIQALRISQSTFQDTFENASVGISHVGLDGRWLTVNQRLCDITGYSRDELLAKKFQEITHPEDLDLDLEQYEQLVEGKIDGYQMEKRYFHKDGHTVWIHISASMQRDTAGKPLYCIAVIQDISDRKRLEAYDRFLIELGDRLAKAQTETEAAALALHQLGKHLGVDRCILAEPDDKLGVVFYPDYHPDMPSLEGIYPLKGIFAEIQAELAQGKQVVIEDSASDAHTAASDAALISPYKMRAYVFTALPRPSDESWWGTLAVATRQPRRWQAEELGLLRSVAHLLLPTLDKLRLLATLRNKETDLRQSEETLRESELHFRQALERSGLVNFHQDLSLRYTWLYNPLKIYPEIEPLGKTDAELFEAEDAAGLAEIKQHVLRSGQGEHSEITLHLGGKVCYFDAVLEPSYDASGAITGLVGSVLDVSARREAEEAIKDYMLKLERSNQDLQDFAFTASHDLQEPLHKVIAFGDRLKDHYNDAFDEEGRDFLTRMISATERMRKMIDDLLAYSRVTTKAQPFARVDLSQVARDVLVDLEARIESSRGKVDIDHLPVIDADEPQMQQLLLNLIGNALKFQRPHEAPQVKISAQRSGMNQVELRISDNGVGFDTQYLMRIFQPFTRLHGRSEYEGSGIGLAICRRIVERHGGTITAESTPEQGSTFIVRLPVKH